MRDLASAVRQAQALAGLSQRDLADKTGISQPTLNRILTGVRAPKMPELILIADATGCTIAQLVDSQIADRVQCAARATNGSDMESMRQRLLHFIELDAYLDDQAITKP